MTSVQGSAPTSSSNALTAAWAAAPASRSSPGSRAAASCRRSTSSTDCRVKASAARYSRPWRRGRGARLPAHLPGNASQPGDGRGVLRASGLPADRAARPHRAHHHGPLSHQGALIERVEAARAKASAHCPRPCDRGQDFDTLAGKQGPRCRILAHESAPRRTPPLAPGTRLPYTGGARRVGCWARSACGDAIGRAERQEQVRIR